MALTRPLASATAVSLLALALLVLLPDCASACTCMIPSSGQTQQEIAKQALSDSAAVFAGEVVDISAGEPLTVSFRVSEVWKGPERGTLEVTTSSQESACGYPFEEGREYLVYAGQGYKDESVRRPSDRTMVSICGDTKPLSKASAHLEALENGGTSGGIGTLSDTSGGVPRLGIVAMAGLAIAAVASVVLLRLLRIS
jgi:hypothetical protein